jgi:two-component system, chemotaxis family, response regulator Rcp1
MTSEMQTRPAKLLLVEDNPGDVRLTMEALKEGRVINDLTVVGDGEEAIAFLRQQGQYANAERPDLVLLDLNLPKKGGLEVLAEIKQDPHLKQIPVVVLTTSQAEQDVLRTYDQHANCYIVKPVDLNQFMDVVHSIRKFWLAVVMLPPQELP